MIRTLKTGIKRALSLFGIVIFKRGTGIYIAEEEIPSLALRLSGIAEPMVVDGGAHKGAFVDAIRRSCPRSKFVCFEPDPTLAAGLRQRFSADPSVQVVQCALGSVSGKAIFNINQSRATNSLAPVVGGTTGVLNALTATQERIEVAVTTLDDSMRDRAVEVCDIIKLDLQGYDFPALKGAALTLKSAKVLIVEVWFAPVYTSGPTYLETCEFLRNSGFELYNLAGLHYGTNDRLMWSDAIFVRKESSRLSEPLTIG